MSSLEDVEEAVQQASHAAQSLVGLTPDRITEFRERYADRIEEQSDELVEFAYKDTTLPIQIEDCFFGVILVSKLRRLQ